MIRSFVVGAVLLITMSAPHVVLADTTSPTYQSAKAAMMGGNCMAALFSFAKYEQEDAAYLMHQPLLHADIKEAEAFCLRQPQVVVALSSSSPVAPPPTAPSPTVDKFGVSGIQASPREAPLNPRCVFGGC